MRRAWIVGLLLARPAWATPVHPTPVDDPTTTDFWRGHRAARRALPAARPARRRDPLAALTLVSFALAVHYDRAEQAGAAFDVLDRMQTTLQRELGPFVQRALALMRFAPAEDRDYYQAVLYEAPGATTEARAEGAMYARPPDAPWRYRALQHIRLLDTQRRAAPSSPHPVTVP